MLLTRHTPLAALALAALLGCSAEVGRPTGSGSSPSPGDTGAGPGGSPSPGASGVPAPPMDFLDPPSVGGVPADAAPTALRRLTNDEYRNTIADLLGLPSPPAGALQPEPLSLGFKNSAAVLTVSSTLAQQYEDLVASAIAQVSPAQLATLAPCATPGAEATCASNFIRSFGQLAFRRPLTAAEEQAYSRIYDAGRDGGTYDEGIRLVLHALLASPKLVYRSELGVPTADGRRLLTSHEIASALAYMFTARPPDAVLRSAADSNQLATLEQVEAQARRLLKSEQAREPLRQFIFGWFGLGNIGNLAKDPEIYPTFTDELRSAMVAEANQYIDSVLWERDATARTLLTSPSSFVNTSLASLYGVPDPGQGATLVPTTLDAAERSGLLTSAAVMAVHSKRGDSFPIARGKFVRKGLLCQALPDPPEGVLIVTPPPDPSLTTRERFALHSESPACATCHALIDPLGFGLENYDAIGQFRTAENGKPVDAAGMLTGTPDVDGAFSGGPELAAKLAASSVTAECVGVQATRWAFGRAESESDRQVARHIAQLLSGNVDIPELLVMLTKTQNFFIRTARP
jgi:hypothetical protein